MGAAGSTKASVTWSTTASATQRSISHSFSQSCSAVWSKAVLQYKRTLSHNAFYGVDTEVESHPYYVKTYLASTDSGLEVTAVR